MSSIKVCVQITFKVQVTKNAQFLNLLDVIIDHLWAYPMGNKSTNVVQPMDIGFGDYIFKVFFHCGFIIFSANQITFF